MANIIQTAEDCSISKFMDCAFKQKYKVLLVEGVAGPEELKNAFELVYSDWIDLAGLYQTKEFEIYAYISSLQRRVSTIKEFVRLQKEFINQFNVPFVAGFGIVKQYGHSLYYDFNTPDLQGFIRKLDAIKIKESKYQTIIDNKINDLIEMRKKKNAGEYNPLQSRKDFIGMLQKLQQLKYVIDKDKTTMEELAIMVTDSKDESETVKAQQQKAKR